MATQFYGLDRGMQATTITTSTSTTGKTFEFTANLASNCTKQEALLAMEAIQRFILDERTTPFK
jgi:hypothetical protein